MVIDAWLKEGKYDRNYADGWRLTLDHNEEFTEVGDFDRGKHGDLTMQHDSCFGEDGWF